MMHAVLLHRRSAAALTARLARRTLSDEPRRVTNLEIVRQNTALITYADGTTEQRDTRTLRQDDATNSKFVMSYFLRTVKTWFCIKLFLVSFN